MMRVNYNISDNEADMEDILMEKAMRVLVTITIVDGAISLIVVALAIALMVHMEKIQFMLEWLAR
jgi:hypothetical protein